MSARELGGAIWPTHRRRANRRRRGRGRGLAKDAEAQTRRLLLRSTTVAEIRAKIDLSPGEIARAAYEGRLSEINSNPDSPAALAALIPRSTWY